MPLERILLATDLSARSDRAMDRASLLRKQHGAELVVVHVLEPSDDLAAALHERYSSRPTAERLVELARRQLVDDLRHAGERVNIRVEDGVPADVILGMTNEQRFDLVVTGVARNDTFGRFTLGRTVARLVRDARTPVLVVTDRAREPYRQIVVACDFSVTSRNALETAAALLLDRPLTVFHAFETPYGLYKNATPLDKERYRQDARRECEEFIRSANLPDETRASLRVLVEHGKPASLLRELGLASGIDLLVLGSARRGAVLHALVGSTAQRIVAMLPCDALVVPNARTEVGGPT